MAEGWAIIFKHMAFVYGATNVLNQMQVERFGNQGLL